MSFYTLFCSLTVHLFMMSSAALSSFNITESRNLKEKMGLQNDTATLEDSLQSSTYSYHATQQYHPRYLPRQFKAYAHTQNCMPTFIAALPIITIKIGNKQYVLLNVPYHKLWYIHRTYTIWLQKVLSG